jgi:carboxymethylenebutenolidase
LADLETPYFVARPKGPVTAGLVVIAEGGSIEPPLLRICERLAGEGYAVAAPEYYFRTGGPGAKPMGEQYGEVKMDEMLGDLTAASDVLRGLGANRIGVTGFCLGGSYTWYAACNGEGYEAAVGFYGGDIPGYIEADPQMKPSCPTLLFYGGTDQWIPREGMDAVAAHHANTIIYPNAGHAFMRDGSDMYVAEAATDAWDRMLAHFREHLG